MKRLRRQWRWLVVAAGIGALLGAPVVARARPVDAPSVAPAELAERISRSHAEPYSGYLEIWGGLRFPSTRFLDEELGLVSETNHLRVWVRDPQHWRIDQLSVAGENDVYRVGDDMYEWQSNQREVDVWAASDSWRLPRSFDFSPPELGRRLVAAAAPADLEPIAPRRVAGRAVPGLRIRPDDPATTVEYADVWADADTGLPVEVEIVPTVSDTPIVSSRFLDLDLAVPSESDVAMDVSATVDFEPATDLFRFPLDRFVNVPVDGTELPPDDLAGLVRRSPDGASAATYGDGLGVVLVVKVPEFRFGRFDSEDLIERFPLSARDWGGSVHLVQTPLINAMAIPTNFGYYLVGGLVTLAELDRVAEVLVAIESAQERAQ